MRSLLLVLCVVFGFETGKKAIITHELYNSSLSVFTAHSSLFVFTAQVLLSINGLVVNQTMLDRGSSKARGILTSILLLQVQV